MSEKFCEGFEHLRTCSDDQQLGMFIMRAMAYATARIAAKGYAGSPGAVQRLAL